MLQQEIEKIKFLLNKVLIDLDLIESEEFQKNFDNAKQRMMLVQKAKNDLISAYPMEELRKFSPELTSLTKQIQKKYDNIIANKKRQLRIIEERLRILQNRKKLLNYSR